MPGETGFLPELEPFHFCSRLHEELHFHLFELAHAEDELTRNNLVAESLANLCDTEGELHATRFLHIEVVDEDSLRGLWTEIDG